MIMAVRVQVEIVAMSITGSIGHVLNLSPNFSSPQRSWKTIQDAYRTKGMKVNTLTLNNVTRIANPQNKYGSPIYFLNLTAKGQPRLPSWIIETIMPIAQTVQNSHRYSL